MIDTWLRWELAGDTTNFNKVSYDARMAVVTCSATEPLRVVQLLVDYQNALADLSLQALTETSTKSCVEEFVDKLRPVEFREHVNTVLSRQRELKRNWNMFTKWLRTECREYDKYTHVQNRSTRTPTHGQGNNKSGAIAAAAASATLSRPTDASASGTNRKSKKTPRGGTRGHKVSAANSATPLCLNKTKCPGAHHFLRDCTKSTDTEKKTILAEWREQKRARPTDYNAGDRTPKKAKVEAIPILSPADPSFSTNRVPGILADTFPVSVLGDTGAELNLIDTSSISRLENLGKLVSLSHIAPISLAVAFADHGRPLSVSSTTTLNLELQLNESGRLRLRDVTFHVSTARLTPSSAHPEVILGTPLLDSLGFRFQGHLERLVAGNGDSETRPAFGAVGSEASAESGSLGPADSLSAAPSAPSSTPIRHISRSHRIDDDPFESDRDFALDIGEDTPVELETARAQLVANAKDEGMSLSGLACLAVLVESNKDIFRLRLSAAPPAHFPPMRVELKPNAIPVRQRLRRYSPIQNAFISTYVHALEKRNYIQRTSTAQWIAAPNVVPKPGPAKFRFTVDSRPVNRATVPITYPLPHMESALASLHGSRCFAKVDLSAGYCQISLDVACQDYFAFVTPTGVYKPTRLLQGSKNAAAYFQMQIHTALISSELHHHTIQWLDDILLHAASESALRGVLSTFFEMCRRLGIFLHAAKCVLFATEISFCGRRVSASGTVFDPRRWSALCAMSAPLTGADLQQFYCALGWMRRGIIDFARRVQPLHAILEEVYRLAGGRTRRHAARIPLATTSWGPIHVQLLHSLQNQSLVKLHHYDAKRRLALYVDASAVGWAAMLTQIPPDELNKPHAERDHQPLAFLSGLFRGASIYWSVVEKECFSIIRALTTLDYFCQTPAGVHIYTDHRNLVFLLDPRGVEPRLHRHTAAKLLRWGVRLQAFEYTIEHISSDDNVWADCLTRWGAPRAVLPGTQTLSVSRLLSTGLCCAEAEESLDDTPCLDEIATVQRKACQIGAHPPSGFMQSEDSHILQKDGVIWIPEKERELILRLLVISHTGRGGHRGVDSLVATLRSRFYWSNLTSDARSFVSECLHCAWVSNKVGARPLHAQVHGTRINEVIHFDFLFVGLTDRYAYILIVKEDITGYVWLQPCEEPTADVVIDTLTRWFSTFGVAEVWVSDKGSHFLNNVVGGLRKTLNVKHRFTLPYCPWSNGTVERVCREILRLLRALYTEIINVSTNEWPKLISLVQLTLNGTYRPAIGTTPMNAFIGAKDSVLDSIFTTGQPSVELVSPVHVRDMHRQLITDTVAALDAVHRKVVDKITTERSERIRAHNARTNVADPRFAVGDFVLTAAVLGNRHVPKLCIRWRGPGRIVRTISETSYEVEQLLTGTKSVIHYAFLKRYADRSLNVTEQVLNIMESNEARLSEQTVEKLLKLRKPTSSRPWEVLVKWGGLKKPTWEPATIIQEDVPKMFEDFLNIVPSRIRESFAST